MTDVVSARPCRRLARRALIIVATIATALFALPATAHAGHPATVGNTDGDGLNIRQAPTTASSPVGLAQTGDVIDVTCQAYGQWVTNTRGFSSNLWDYSSDDGGYLADAYMNTGYDGRIPGVPECDDAPPPGGDITPLQQNQGQFTQWEDCGPTSVVAALLALGITPHGWNTSTVESIHRAREDMGLARNVKTGGTNETQVNRAFATYGLSTYTSWNLDTILAHVRSGRPVVLAGNTIDLPWPVNVASPNGVPHFLTVAGYDGNGGYLVVDPIAVNNTVKVASRATLAAFFDHNLGRAGVLA
ncbi:C39 family peptidase [Stackebrandtia soli]|uniref:C39 family peptidase n=1 Tax=Stackebrandtia soli TaxID=1892856 RepID=UPI0039E904C9